MRTIPPGRTSARYAVYIDTRPVILAVASPPVASWRGIVRASGAACFELLRPHLEPMTTVRAAHMARLRIDGLDLPCLVLVFPAPGSYTGENCAELQLPGNPLLLERVIDTLLASAAARGVQARRAEPGEFTSRAFFNGRLSLTEAEGVAATIAAQSDAQLRAARFLQGGGLGVLAGELSDELATLLALVEAGIDFSDQDDVTAIEAPRLAARLESLRTRIDERLQNARGAEKLEAMPWVMLTGAPNAGKSTLFNALLGRWRAVVSEVPGTTRDVLTEPLVIETPAGPAEVMLVDAAGQGDASSPIERLMQTAAYQAAQRSELRLRCVPAAGGDPTLPPGGAPGELLVRTKSDLAPSSRPFGLAVSAREGHGLPELRRAIATRLAERAVSLAADAVVLGPRHQAALRGTLANLDEALALVRGQPRLQHPELAAAAMRLALDHLGDLAGDILPDEILGRIFSTFCVGK